MNGPGGFSPAAGGPGFSPTPRRSTALTVSVAAAVVAILGVVGVAVWNFALDPIQVAPGPTPTVTSIPPTNQPVPTTDLPPITDPPPATDAPPTTEPPPPPPPPEPPAEFPVGAQPCPIVYGAQGGYRASAVGNAQTSCPFAEEVRLAYGQQPVRDLAVVVDAYSPVTGVTYTMTCQPGRLVNCTGGNNAVVHII